jgi:hypothetical protein
MFKEIHKTKNWYIAKGETGNYFATSLHNKAKQKELKKLLVSLGIKTCSCNLPLS